MPELPEVETIIRQICSGVIGKEITGLVVTPKGLKMIGRVTPDELLQKISGTRISKILRHGKFIIFELSNSWQIVAHLRMSGRFTVTAGKPDQSTYNRLFLRLSGPTFLNFLDIRRFGTFHLIKDRSQYPGLQRLGKDALDTTWIGELFFEKLQQHKKSIYSCLLDQSIISGVGNIYANEALFLSKINPLRAANRLTVRDSKKLLHSVIDILSTALQFQGTTLIDNSYKDSEGKSGNFRKLLKVYGRAGEACVTCGTPINRIRIGNRSVYFCPHCQRK